MFLGIDWAPWLPVITALLIILTVVVGVRGLYQDHTKDGKLTRAGWGIVAAMVLLGFLTFASGMLDQRIAAEKERAEAAEREQRFQRQMSALKGVTGSLSQLQTDMRGSLGQQQRQFDVANRTLGMSEALQRQAQANTLSVLQRVFAEGNRITAERITISVLYTCGRPSDDIVAPRIVSAMLSAQNSSREMITLTSSQSNFVGVETIFYGFMGDLGPFDTFNAWGDAYVSILLSAVTRPEDVRTADQISTTDRRERQAKPRNSPECFAEVRLFLNNRQVLWARRGFVDWGNGIHLANFPLQHIDRARLPRF